MVFGTALGAPDPSGDVLPVARTVDEANLYMDLHGCGRCGSANTDWSSGLVSVVGRLARRYNGRCSGCGADREFVFGAPERPLIPPASTRVFFGGAEPSELLDAGEWLWVADLTAGRSPSDPAGAVRALAIAAAAVDEIIKFVPAGSDVVPDGAFWSVRGNRVRAEEPGRFDRGRLEVVRDSYLRQLAELEASGR